MSFSLIEVEKQLRPTGFIGWNIYEGGGDPPHGSGENNNFFGQKHDEKTRRKMSLAAKRRKKPSHTTPHTEETKQLIKARMQSLPRTECPHCSKMVLPQYRRFHWDECKSVQSR